jgi:hypothetical protein
MTTAGAAVVNNPLYQQFMNSLDLHSNQTQQAEKAKVANYIRETDDIRVKVKHVSNAIIVLSAGTGATALGLAGAGIGTLVEPGGGTAIGAVSGAALGGAIGGVVGKVIAKRKIPVWISRTRRFNEWKRKAITEKLYPTFAKILNDNNDFKSLMCPINHELPSIPVQAPCEHVFEYQAIVEWQKRKLPGGACCGTGWCDRKFTVNDLIFAQDHLFKIMSVVKKQIDILSVKQDPVSIEFLKGCFAIHQDAVSVTNQVFNAEMENEVEDLFRHDMTEAEAAEVAVKALRAKKAQKELQSTKKV